MKKAVLLILIIATVLVSIWFKGGNILGTAEDGLYFYNISNYYHQMQYAWMEYPGLGSPSFTLPAGKPTFLLLSILQNIGIPGFLIQAGVMWFILVSSAIGVFLVARIHFSELSPKYLFLSVCFYWFNPITLVDVWNRFLLNYIFFYALIPISTYLYIKGLKSRQLIWPFILNLVLLVYSFAFSYVAFIMLFWIWLIILTSLTFLFEKERKVVFFYCRYFFISLALFVLLNSWWILPLLALKFSGGAGPTSNLFASQDNLNIFDAISNSTGQLVNLFKLSNGSFLSPDSLSWVKFYVSASLAILLFFLVGTFLYTAINLRKNTAVSFLTLLFFLLIFLAKGSSPPFGEIYRFFYKHIILLQVFRNSFEKFGFLLSLVASVLLSISASEIELRVKNELKRLVYPVLILIVLVYLGFPLYTELALTNKFPPTNNYSVGYQVQVPPYYKDLNNYLNDMGNNFRSIGFPIKDEGITYNWAKGYAGVELAVALYDSKGVFHNTSTPFFNKIAPNIEPALFSGNQFSNLANALNARYYLLRYDIDYKLRALTDPAVIEKVLAKLADKGEVKKVAEFGKVEVWKNLNWTDDTFYDVQKLVPVNNFDNANLSMTKTSSGEAMIDIDGISKIQNKISFDTQAPHIGIGYQRINPTKYIVHIKNSTHPFLLVFSELYNDGWQAEYVNRQLITNHLRLNIYANGWIIDRTGDFDIEIKFIPQDWMDIGEKISLFSIPLISLGLVLYLVRRK